MGFTLIERLKTTNTSKSSQHKGMYFYAKNFKHVKFGRSKKNNVVLPKTQLILTNMNNNLVCRNQKREKRENQTTDASKNSIIDTVHTKRQVRNKKIKNNSQKKRINKLKSSMKKSYVYDIDMIFPSKNKTNKIKVLENKHPMVMMR